MNKVEFASAIAEKVNMKKKDAEVIVQAMLDVITESLVKGEKIQFVNFGTFETVERAARNGTNPQTGEDIHVPAYRAPKFKPGRTLKDAVKNI